MKHITLLVLFTLSSYSTFWYGKGKLDLWHESTVPIYKNLGVGTELVADFYEQSNPNLVYGYLFGYYRVNNHIRVMVGKDYEGRPVFGSSFNWTFKT